MTPDEIAPPPQESDADRYEAWRNDEQHALRCQVELSATYHAKRERFLVFLERLAQGTAALTATAAFAQAVGSESSPYRWLSLAAAAASIFPLVFGWTSRANHHATLAGDHRRLLAEITAAGYTLDEEQLVRFRTQLCAIEATERASLGALVVHCQNELAIARGEKDSIVPLKRYQRLLMHCWDWDVVPPDGKPTQPGVSSTTAPAATASR